MRYLSLEWIDAVHESVAASTPLRDLARDVEFGITQVVTGGPEGDVVYHFSVGDGSVEFGPGPAPREDVRLEQSWQTAVAVATEQMGAQDVFIRGHVTVTGDVQKLVDSQRVFGPLDEAFAAVRGTTVYE
ncbi:MAG: hypothetical protein RL330_948 [Actinomycetota bacterium]|jgi:hypothetical protein